MAALVFRTLLRMEDLLGEGAGQAEGWEGVGRVLVIHRCGHLAHVIKTKVKNTSCFPLLSGENNDNIGGFTIFEFCTYM